MRSVIQHKHEAVSFLPLSPDRTQFLQSHSSSILPNLRIVLILTKTKSYLPGGFCTDSGMVDALNIVDGIGLGRPLCQEPYEPYLCSHILAALIRCALPFLCWEK